MITEAPVKPASEEEALRRTRSGLDTQELLAAWKLEKDLPVAGLNREERLYRHYTRYNWERFTRVTALYTPTSALVEAVRGIEGPMTWLFLTENWCADAAYSLPVVLAAAEAHGDTTVRYLLRDANLDVMERYLTGSARSIPILAAFDHEGNEVLRWGPKPRALAHHRATLVASGADGRAVSAGTIAWYDDDGWLEVEKELTVALGELAKD
ncbi:MAG: thioredoxin family protein [Rhodothermales bacterium]|nr:thioredoxin family protein [Rhodothermales bacterium]